MIDEASIIAALADPARASRLLLAAAQINSDIRYRHAAGILRGRPAGRRARDDTTAVRQVAALLKIGHGRFAGASGAVRRADA